jgi:sortase (surface protein transpeptidase)
MAFAHIAELKQGDMIQVVRNGTLYQYKVIDIQVKYPQHVNDTYMQYQ